MAELTTNKSYTDSFVPPQVTVPSGSHWVATVYIRTCMRGDCYRVNIGRCCCVHSNHRNRKVVVCLNGGLVLNRNKNIKALEWLLSERKSHVTWQLWGFLLQMLSEYFPAPLCELSSCQSVSSYYSLSVAKVIQRTKNSTKEDMVWIWWYYQSNYNTTYFKCV